MNIGSEHIAYKRKVGTLKGKPVVELRTTGGLHLVAIAQDGVPTILGVGPHKAVARHIAQKKEPGIQWSELSKSDYVAFEAYEYILPRYEELTNQLRSLQG